MTQIFKRAVAGLGTHALVVGVGHCPDAKPGRGVRKELRTVQNLPSAADGAKLMCDWLIANCQTGSPLLSHRLKSLLPTRRTNRTDMHG